MKRTMMIIMAMAFSMLMAVSANAGPIAGGPTAPGATIEMDASTGIPGSEELVFNPSPQVEMVYYSNRDGFAHAAVHAAAKGTDGGMSYAMASDTNKVYWVTTSAETFTLVRPQTANSFEWETTQNAYNPMQ